jgi:hypothetical protein
VPKAIIVLRQRRLFGSTKESYVTHLTGASQPTIDTGPRYGSRDPFRPWSRCQADAAISASANAAPSMTTGASSIRSAIPTAGSAG